MCRFLIAFLKIILLLVSLVRGFRLIMRLVTVTILGPRLIMSMAPFPLCSRSSSAPTCVTLRGRSLTAGLLKMHAMLASDDLRRWTTPACRVLLLDKALVGCLRDRHFRLTLMKELRAR